MKHISLPTKPCMIWAFSVPPNKYQMERLRWHDDPWCGILMSKEAVLSRLFSLLNKKRASKTSKNQSRRTVSNMALTFSILHPKPSRTNFKNFSSCLGLPKPSPHPHPTFASLFVSAGGRVPSRCGRAWWGRRPISMWPQPWACASMAWFHDMVTRAPAWQLEVPGRNQRWALETHGLTPKHRK